MCVPCIKLSDILQPVNLSFREFIDLQQFTTIRLQKTFMSEKSQEQIFKLIFGQNPRTHFVGKAVAGLWKESSLY
jgi:hypothetical protein